MALQSPALPPTFRDLFRGAQRTRSLAIILMLLLATLDVLIVATAMPTILQQLGDVQYYSWVFSGYTLSSLAALPIFSALTGPHGLLRTMTLAVAIFLLGSVIAALAPSMLALVIGRAVQGIGAGGLFALPNLIIARYYPSALQPRALAMGSAVWGISSLAGPLVGGVLLTVGGWPLIFWVNVPLCALVLALGVLGLQSVSEERAPNPQRVNIVGPLLLTGAATLLLAAGTAQRPLSFALATAGLVVAVALALTERRSSQPLIPAAAWRVGGTLGVALLTMLAVSVGFFAAETFLPPLLQLSRGMSAVLAGVLISIGSIGWSSGTFYIARRDDLGPRQQVLRGVVALLAGVVGLLLLIAFQLPGALAFLFWPLAGLGMGIVYPACATVVLDCAHGRDAASITASGQLALSLGTAAGAATAGVLAAWGFGADFAPGSDAPDVITPQIAAAIDRGVAYALLLALAALLVTLLAARRLPHQREIAPDERSSA